MFELKVEEKDVLLEELQKPWQVQERAMEADISVLKLVEDLEQRVVSADLHLKVRNLQRLIVQCLIVTPSEHKYCDCCFVGKIITKIVLGLVCEKSEIGLRTHHITLA